MQKIFWSIMTMFMAAPVVFANDSLDIGTAETGAGTILDMVFLGAKVIGAIAIILGIVELLVEKDQGGQQGKKVSGSMKLVGGVLLLVAASVIGWAVGTGSSTSGSGASLLGGKASGNGVPQKALGV